MFKSYFKGEMLFKKKIDKSKTLFHCFHKMWKGTKAKTSPDNSYFSKEPLTCKEVASMLTCVL